MVSYLCERKSQHTFAAQIMKALIKYLLSFLIILWSGFNNLNAHADKSLVGHSSLEVADQLLLNEYGFAELDHAFISLPSSNNHHPNFEIEAIEVEVQEDEVVNAPKFLESSPFTAVFLVSILGLLFNQANQALRFRRHFFFFTSFSLLFIKLRVIRI